MRSRASELTCAAFLGASVSHARDCGGAAARTGDLVCFPGRSKLAWRRVLGVKGTKLRVRPDVAPREDGWVDSSTALGRMRLRVSVDALAHVAPSAWTHALYSLATLALEVKALTAQLRLRRSDQVVESHAMRVLGEQDRELYARFHAARSEADGVARALPASCGYPVAVGICGVPGELIGTQLMEWPSPDDCYLHTFFVAPSARGKGVGAGLKAFAIATAKAHGARRARCFVHARNMPSIAANVRAGMRVTGEWLTDPHDPLSAMTYQLLEMAIDL
jgi:GNAT superfamily N-acetyltransferase